MIVEVDGGSVFTCVAGEGPPLLIPGYASTPRFRRQASLFEDEFTVVGCDVRGEGLQTDFPEGAFTVDQLADDCAGVLVALGYDRAHYLGHSHTGIIGQALALRHPERVDRLVLTNTSPGLQREEGAVHELPIPAGPFTDAMMMAERGDPAGVRMLGGLMLSPLAEEDSVLLDACTEFFVPVFGQSPTQRSHAWAAFGAWIGRDRLADIQARTLVLTSDADRMAAPADAWAMRKAIPRAVLVALHGVGHDWITEAPFVGAGIVKMFLRGELDAAYE